MALEQDLWHSIFEPYDAFLVNAQAIDIDVPSSELCTSSEPSGPDAEPMFPADQNVLASLRFQSLGEMESCNLKAARGPECVLRNCESKARDVENWNSINCFVSLDCAANAEPDLNNTETADDWNVGDWNPESFSPSMFRNFDLCGTTTTMTTPHVHFRGYDNATMPGERSASIEWDGVDMGWRYNIQDEEAFRNSANRQKNVTSLISPSSRCYGGSNVNVGTIRCVSGAASSSSSSSTREYDQERETQHCSFTYAFNAVPPGVNDLSQRASSSGNSEIGRRSDGTIRRHQPQHTGRTKDITFSELTKYFHMPITQAARELKVGLTILKKRCREFGISRWPHRKVKSLESLIRNIQELGKSKEGLNQARLANVVEILEEQRRLMEEMPGIELAERTKKLRQACFKANYKRRQQLACSTTSASLGPERCQ